jgi:hypothetical protein
MDKKHEFETNVVKPSLSFWEKDQEYRLIDFSTEIALDSKIQEIENFMRSNDGKDQSDEFKDNLYANAIQLWEEYASILRSCKYSFYLNKKQYMFLTDLLIEKMEYDVNTVFFAIELTDMLGTWKSIGTNNKDENFLQSYQTNATEITYIYHLIAKHKVKGLSHSSYRFAEILKRIGGVSKIIGYYDTTAKNLSKEIQEWVASFEPEPTSVETQSA